MHELRFGGYRNKKYWSSVTDVDQKSDKLGHCPLCAEYQDRVMNMDSKIYARLKRQIGACTNNLIIMWTVGIVKISKSINEIGIEMSQFY